jgi:hypothetical protein
VFFVVYLFKEPQRHKGHEEREEREERKTYVYTVALIKGGKGGLKQELRVKYKIHKDYLL